MKKARLNPEQQKALLADQNGWVHSYPRTCGLTDAPPALPLAPAIQDCMAQAGRARIAYLRNYGASEATTSATTSYAANPADVRSQMAPVVPEPPVLSAEDERQAEICKEQNYPFQISAACVNLKVKQGKVEISQKCGNSIVTLSDEVSAACIDLKEKLLTYERSFCSDPRFSPYLDFCDH